MCEGPTPAIRPWLYSADGECEHCSSSLFVPYFFSQIKLLTAAQHQPMKSTPDCSWRWTRPILSCHFPFSCHKDVMLSNVGWATPPPTRTQHMNQWRAGWVYNLFLKIFFKVFKRCYVLCGSYEYCVFIPGVKQCWQIKILLFGYLKKKCTVFMTLYRHK